MTDELERDVARKRAAAVGRRLVRHGAARAHDQQRDA